jgi:hypothetical protein
VHDRSPQRVAAPATAQTLVPHSVAPVLRQRRNMKKNLKRRLNLVKTTIRPLQPNKLEEVKGGVMATFCCSLVCTINCTYNGCGCPDDYTRAAGVYPDAE